MKNMKITISVIMTLLMILSSFSMVTADPEGPCGPKSDDTEIINVDKNVWNGTAWVDAVEANLSDIVRFNITISYYSNNDTTSYMETNISVEDVLPDCLEFAENIQIIYGPFEYSGYTAKSEDNKTIWWNLTDAANDWLDQDINLYNTTKYPEYFDTVSIYFDAEVVDYTDSCGEENVVCVTAWETCTTHHVYGYSDATVIAEEPENPDISIDKKIKDPVSGEWVDGPLNIYYEDLGVPAELEFQINVSNTGNVDLTNIVLTDVLPDFLFYDHASETPDDIDGQKLSWGPFSLPKETKCMLTLVVEVNTSDLHMIRTGENFVNVTAEENLYDEDTVEITIKPHIIVDKKVWDREKGEWVDEVDYVIKSEKVKFKITTTYYGEEIMTCMRVDDWIETQCDGCLEIINGSEKFTYPSEHFEDPKVIAYSPTGIEFKWDCDKMFNLRDGETVEIIFEANVTHYSECILINYASVGLACICPEESYTYEDYDTAIVSCTPPPPLFDKKVRRDNTEEWADEVETIVGETIEFKLELEYYGNTNVTSILAQDKLPCILEYVEFSADAEVVGGDAELIQIEVVDKKRLTFHFNRSLGDNGTITIIFKAYVNGSTGDCSECGQCVNRANVTGNIGDHEGPFFAEDTVNISSDDNCPPDPLWIKTEDGPNGEPGDTMTFTSKIYDRNDDLIKYKFKVGGCYEGDWSDWIESNETIEFEYTFEAVGDYVVQILAKDEHGAESGWQCDVKIIIREGPVGENQKPLKPSIGGPTKGEVDDDLTFTASTIDPDGDQIRYQFNVDGDSDEWSELMDSGDEIEYEISFDKKGTYDIKVRAIDPDGKNETSAWSNTIQVKITEEDEDDEDEDEEAEQENIWDLILNFLKKFPIIFAPLIKIIELMVS